jgi:FAD/FMN-containing dehydrogenase
VLLEAVARYAGAIAGAEGTAAVLLSADGASIGRRRSDTRRAGPRRHGAVTQRRGRGELWRVRRELSPALKTIAPLKFNHDVVVPKARVPELFRLVDDLKARHRLRIPCFGHVGDGNIHVNVMVSPDDAD